VFILAKKVPWVGEYASTELVGDMKSAYLKSISVDELWDLHEQVVAELAHKIGAEKATLEDRLRRLGNVNVGASEQATRTKRTYPKVFPKYRNPKNRSDTWAGRGKQPRWLVAELRSGKKLDDFRIKRP
jgi:DNA-binding protein H-NS